MTETSPTPEPAPTKPVMPARPALLPVMIAVLALGVALGQPWWVGYVKPAPAVGTIQPAMAPAPVVDLDPVLARLDALESRPVPVASVEKADTSKLESELAALRDAQIVLQKNSEDMRDELSQLRNKVKAGPEATAHKFLLAASLQLMAAWQQGTPFKAQWQAVLATAMPDTDLLRALEDAAPALVPWLEKGVPTLLTLAQDFPTAARAELLAARPDGASFGEKVSRQLQGLVVIRRQGETLSAANADLDAQLNVAETALKSGDLARALSVLSSPAQSAELKSWLTAAKARAQVEGLAQMLTAQAGHYLEPATDESVAP